VTARDRGSLLQVGRGPARVAVADVPNIDAFSLVTSIQAFTPSADAEALVTQQVQLIPTRTARRDSEILADAQAYADGVNAYWAAHSVRQPTFTVNDVVAVTAFIGSIFGAGGGGEAANADLLAKLAAVARRDRGYRVWDDVMLADDPRRRPPRIASTTTAR
jgi:acyl-homoserine lactone acylase PvdQ